MKTIPIRGRTIDGGRVETRGSVPTFDYRRMAAEMGAEKAKVEARMLARAKRGLPPDPEDIRALKCVEEMGGGFEKRAVVQEGR